MSIISFRVFFDILTIFIDSIKKMSQVDYVEESDDDKYEDDNNNNNNDNDNLEEDENEEEEPRGSPTSKELEELVRQMIRDEDSKSKSIKKPLNSKVASTPTQLNSKTIPLTPQTQEQTIVLPSSKKRHYKPLDEDEKARRRKRCEQMRQLKSLKQVEMEKVETPPVKREAVQKGGKPTQKYHPISITNHIPRRSVLPLYIH